MSETTIEDRARELLMKRRRSDLVERNEVPYYMADFAESEFPREREEAVREFVAKVNSPRLVDSDFDEAAAEVFEEMFGKDLG
jgi:hypothetical protein